MKSYEVVLTDDHFLDLVRNMKHEGSQEVLLAFATVFLDGCIDKETNKTAIPAKFFSDADLCPLRLVFERAVDFCRVVLCLLSPAEHGGHSKAVLDALEYRGKVLFQKALRNLLLREVDSVAKDSKEKELISFVRDKVKDVQRTAASHPLAEPTYRKMVAIVGAPDVPSVEDLKWVMTQAKMLGEHLRQGLLPPLLEHMAKHFVHHARAIFTTASPSTDAETVGFLQQALRSLSKLPNCTDAEAKLSAWAAKHNADLAKNEICGRLDSYVAQAEKGKPQPFLCESFVKTLSKCRSNAFDHEQPKVQSALAWLVKEGFQKVPCPIT